MLVSEQTPQLRGEEPEEPKVEVEDEPETEVEDEPEQDVEVEDEPEKEVEDDDSEDDDSEDDDSEDDDSESESEDDDSEVESEVESEVMDNDLEEDDIIIGNTIPPINKTNDLKLAQMFRENMNKISLNKSELEELEKNVKTKTDTKYFLNAVELLNMNELNNSFDKSYKYSTTS